MERYLNQNMNIEHHLINIQISNFLIIRVLHLDDNDVKTNYRRIFSTVSASTPFSTNK